MVAIWKEEGDIIGTLHHPISPPTQNTPLTAHLKTLQKRGVKVDTNFVGMKGGGLRRGNGSIFWTR